MCCVAKINDYLVKEMKMFKTEAHLAQLKLIFLLWMFSVCVFANQADAKDSSNLSRPLSRFSPSIIYL